MDVGVVGAGVIGLTTGLELVRRGHDVTIYSKEFPPHVCSNSTCAIFLPNFTCGPARPCETDVSQLQSWSVASWNQFSKLFHRDAATYGLKKIRAHEMFEERREPPDWLRAVFTDLETANDPRLPAGYTHRWSFDTFIIEAPVYLPRLQAEFQTLGGMLEQRTFESIDEVLSLPEAAVFNCSGRGAKELFGDTAIKGVKGQLLLLEPAELDFAVGAGKFAVMPRSDALVLGSLFQTSFNTQEPTDDNAAKLRSEIRQWAGQRDGVFHIPEEILAPDREVGQTAGIRPCRDGGARVEVETRDGMMIVHDYGHGGGGITLSWGCVLESLRLFEEQAGLNGSGGAAASEGF